MSIENKRFSQVLNSYMQRCRLPASKLAAHSGISASTLSRLRNGKQEPRADSAEISLLSKAIAELSGNELSAEDVYAELNQSAKQCLPDFDAVAARLNTMITALNLNVNDMSRSMSYDASYISRIRSGQRRPANAEDFCAGLADFALSHCEEGALPALAHLIGCSVEELSPHVNGKLLIVKWLMRQDSQRNGATEHFLHTLDSFDLNEYIRAIHFDELKAPALALHLPGSRDYYGLEGYMDAELDWLKASVLSDSAKPLIFYSDMPIEELSKDSDFPRKWMFGIALLLKKGLRLNIIHNLDRPVYEMMLGLESWIPLYMTGQVSPYYLKGYQDAYFHHFLRVSEAAVLSGEAIVSRHKNSRFHLSLNRDDISYCRMRGEDLLSKAQPLMGIYGADKANSFRAFLSSGFLSRKGSFRNILTTPPAYTIPPALLDRMLARTALDQEAAAQIREYVRQLSAQFQEQLANADVTDEIPLLTREEFEHYPALLPLADIFLDAQLRYSYEEYCEHLRQTTEFSKNCPRYHCIASRSHPFRNIQIRIAEGNCAIISKVKSPTIHFVIHHPKLCKAIENISAPISDDPA